MGTRAESYDDAEEAEDFQAIGMKCPEDAHPICSRTRKT